MLFNSSSYLLFFIFVFIINFYLGNRFKLRYLFLLFVSYYFYSAWNGMYLALILVSTIIDYFVSIGIDVTNNKKKRKVLLWLSIIMNLLILFTFKYYNFFIISAYDFFNTIGVPFQYSTLEVLLPVGISFYTFQSMSYTIDVYNKKLQAEKSFTNFALYIAFFPQLVAGPIIRPTDFLPQLKNKYKLTKEDFILGISFIWIGLFKKVVLADFFAIYADNFFNDLAPSSFFDILIGVYSFAFQIYFDFSGYTDVAIGSALLLGFKIPRNFFYPYFSMNLSEFWRRWHISLSKWLRDYIYIPLGGGRVKKYRNIFITFTLSGIWHGAAWNFLIWGIYHAILLIAEDLLKKMKIFTLPLILKQFIVFNLICIGWIFFRIENISDIVNILYIDQMVDITNIKVFHVVIFILVFCLLLLEFYSNKISLIDFLLKQNIGFQIVLHSIIFLLVVVMGSFGKPFIYFQF